MQSVNKFSWENHVKAMGPDLPNTTGEGKLILSYHWLCSISYEKLFTSGLFEDTEICLYKVLLQTCFQIYANSNNLHWSRLHEILILGSRPHEITKNHTNCTTIDNENAEAQNGTEIETTEFTLGPV